MAHSSLGRTGAFLESGERSHYTLRGFGERGRAHPSQAPEMGSIPTASERRGFGPRSIADKLSNVGSF